MMSKSKKYRNNNSEDYIKIALIGNEYVGKTSIVRRYIHHAYDTGYIRTIGGDLWHKKVIVGDNIVNLNLLDTGGEKQQRELITNLFRNTDAVMVVYDINNVHSFEAVDGWISLLLQVIEPSPDRLSHTETGKKRGYQYIDAEPIIVIVGNKTDLRNDENQVKEESFPLISHQVSTNDLKKKAKKHNMKYCEVSAKTGKNLETPFIMLLEEIYSAKEEHSEYGGSLVQSLSGPEGHCCCTVS